jgi:helicase MOV-10
MVEMIIQLLQFPESRILACAPSIAAADTLAIGLARFTEIITPNVMFRLNDCTRKVETLPVDLLRFCCIDDTGSFSLPSSKQLLSFRIVVTTLWDSSLLFESHHTNSSIIEIKTHVRNICNQNLQYLGLTPDLRSESFRHWTHFLIDEAAQGMELDSLIPLSVVLDSSFPVQIVLCGDSKQLGPVIFSKKARKDGLGKSWLGRLIDDQGYDRFPESFGVHLRRNYRSHFSMLMVPSVIYYQDRLVPAASHSETHRFLNFSLAHRNMSVSFSGLLDELYLDSQSSPSWPILFHSVRGKDYYEIDQSSGLSSWKNNEEALQIADWVQFLTQNYKVDTKKIGIMTPYRGQVASIRSILRKVNLGTVNVGTVEDYQGAERPIILLSVTRATPKFVKKDKEKAIGLVHQPRRFNVAVTRAKALFIIVGNPEVLNLDLDWREYLAFCQRHGLWLGQPIAPLNCTKKSVLESSMNLHYK